MPISPAIDSASVGTWPSFSAIGERPTASATAATPRARSGIIFDENSGATTNSGPTRASTRKKRDDVLLADRLEQAVHCPTRPGMLL